jgi:hypothetical protein
MARVGMQDKPYTIKDIRAKAFTDAKRLGYKIDDLQIAGAHTDRSTDDRSPRKDLSAAGGCRGDPYFFLTIRYGRIRFNSSMRR